MGPRPFGIPATHAPVVAVIRRGPSRWCHVGRWDLARDRYQPGALRGRVYPQRCDLSPDGRWRRGLPFDDVQWADWDATGRLLVATTAGRLQIREDKRGAWAVTSEVALGGVTPEPVPPPAEAARW